MIYAQDILRVLFGKDVKDVDTEMVVKKRSEFMADRGKKVRLGGDGHALVVACMCVCVYMYVDV